MSAVLLLVPAAAASPAEQESPAQTSQPAHISLIIDDLGQGRHDGERVVALPGPVACAFLPHRPHVEFLARAADDAGKEVLLHQPLQAVQGEPLGAGGITLEMTAGDLRRTLRENLEAVPAAAGVNTHMGSLLTRHPGHMGWLMRELSRAELMFVDSLTTGASVAGMIADEWDVPHTRRDVFLDADRDPEAIAAQFERLIAIARRKGVAVGIGHPYPETLAFLERTLPDLPERGVELISLRQAIPMQEARRVWRASSSP